MTVGDATGGVRTPYTEEMVQAYLLDLKQLGMSLREIAYVIYGDKLTHGVIQRAMKGEFPKASKKRAALGLSPLVPAPACPICGAAHTIDGVCTAGKAVTVTVRDGAPGVKVRRVHRTGAPRPRASVNTENPDSAFTTLREKTSPEFRRRLLELLQAEGD